MHACAVEQGEIQGCEFSPIFVIQKIICILIGGFNTNWDGHRDGGVVGRGGQFPLSANALSGWVFLNDLH